MVDAADLENDAARLDARHPEFRRTLAGSHADFGRLLRHRNIRKNPKPHAARALCMARNGAARRFDLACGQTFWLHRLEPDLAIGECRAALGVAVNAALEGFAELCPFRLQHDLVPFGSSRFRRRSACVSGSRSTATAATTGTSAATAATSGPAVPIIAIVVVATRAR